MFNMYKNDNCSGHFTGYSDFSGTYESNRTVYVNPNIHMNQANIHINPNFKRKVHINPNFKNTNVYINPSVFIQPTNVLPPLQQPLRTLQTTKILNVKQNIDDNKSCAIITDVKKAIVSTKTKLIRATTTNNTSVNNTPSYNQAIISTKTKLIRQSSNIKEGTESTKIVNSKYRIVKPNAAQPIVKLKNTYGDENRLNKYKVDRTITPQQALQSTKNKFKLDRTSSLRETRTKYKLRNKAYLMTLNPNREIIKRNKLKPNQSVPKMVKIKDRVYRFGTNCDTLFMISSNNKYRKVNPDHISFGGKTYQQKDTNTYVAVSLNDTNKSAVDKRQEVTSACIRFLQGDCYDEKCMYSHKISGKQPTCKAYMKGLCELKNCQYLHTNVNAEICKHFLKGACMHGEKCNKRHKLICPQYEKTATCTTVNCPYPHGYKTTIKENKTLQVTGKVTKTIYKMGSIFQYSLNKKYLYLIRKGPYSFKTVVINGVQYSRKTNKVYVAVSTPRNKIKINSVMLKKDNSPCIVYRNTGKCANKENGKCFKQHNPNQISICTRFLQGDCHKSPCLLSHKVLPEKMPTCKFYLEGMCHRTNCQYLHVKLNAKASICKDFLNGYCQKGIQCDKRHQFLCPNFESNTPCNKKKCPYPHGTAVRQYTDKILNRIARNTKQKQKFIFVNTIKVKTNLNKRVKKLPDIKTSNSNSEPTVRYYKGDIELENSSVVNSIDIVNEETCNTTDEKCDNNCDVKTNLLNRPKLGSLPSYIPFGE